MHEIELGVIHKCHHAIFTLLSACLSHRNSVRLSVHPSVCHTGGSVKNSAS